MEEEIWLPEINNERCTGCGDCVAICSTEALALVHETAVLIEPAACNYCAECETICPVDAITLPYQIILESSL